MLFIRRKIMRLFDLHCDTLYRALEENKGLYENNFDISISKTDHFSKWIQCFAIWIPDEVRDNNAVNLVKNAYKKLCTEMQSNSNYIEQCKNRQELENIFNSKKDGAIFTIEGSAALGGNLDNLYEFSKYGVKMITLTWNSQCEAGPGAFVENSLGITEFGKKLVSKMNELNIIVDISHANDRLFYDVASISNKPIVASHSNSREICKHKRNLTDDQFNHIRKSGGIVGINLCKDFLCSEKEPTFSDIEKHIDHFLTLSGENTIAFGADLDGADTPNDFKSIESMQNLYEYFLKRNYNESLLDNIFFGNAYRFFKNNI